MRLPVLNPAVFFSNNTIMHDLLIIGAGIFGCSVAWNYLKLQPEKKVLIIEMGSPLEGSTSRAAALISAAREDTSMIPLILETIRQFNELEEFLNISIPKKRNGAIHIAANESEIQLLEKLNQITENFNIQSINPDSADVLARLPWLQMETIKKMVYFPNEIITDAYIFGNSYKAAAKAAGAQIVIKEKVDSLILNNGTVTGVRTDKGEFYASDTVLAAGVWSSKIALRSGINLPMAAVRSQFWVTENKPELFKADAPTVIIPSARFYSRPYGEALLFGLRETNSLFEYPDRITDDQSNYLFSNDNGWSDLEENYNALLPFFPYFPEIGIARYFAGFSAYTPDKRLIAGSVEGFSNLWIATGCSGAGISVAGGLGLGLARIISKQDNPFDFRPFSPNRIKIFDSMNEAHLQRCADARSSKKGG